MKDRKPRKPHMIPMEEGLITFETAKLAKAKNCDINTVVVYDGEGNLTLDIGVNNEDLGMDNEAYPVFTQSVLQKWLRGKHNIQMEIRCKQKGYGVFDYTYAGHVYSNLVKETVVDADCAFDTYEEALEDALVASLNLIESNLN